MRVPMFLSFFFVLAGCAMQAGPTTEKSLGFEDGLFEEEIESSGPALSVDGDRFSLGDAALTIDAVNGLVTLEVGARTIEIPAEPVPISELSDEIQESAAPGSLALQLDAGDIQLDEAEHEAIAALAAEMATFQPTAQVAASENQCLLATIVLVGGATFLCWELGPIVAACVGLALFITTSACE